MEMIRVKWVGVRYTLTASQSIINRFFKIFQLLVTVSHRRQDISDMLVFVETCLLTYRTANGRGSMISLRA